MNKKFLLIAAFIPFVLSAGLCFSQKAESGIKLARVKYSGGGDWYNDPSSEVNLLKFVSENTNIKVAPVYEYVDLATDDLFNYPLIFLTGHGGVNFSKTETEKLRAYLDNGGFLYIDDDYGLEKDIKEEMKKVFPDKLFEPLKSDHPIFRSHFVFPKGMPKIHEHDDKQPEVYGIYSENRLCVFFTVETNPSDGWADPEVHNDTPEKRRVAMEIGTNIIVYALTN